MNLQALSEERDSLSDDCDSGNDEPSDYFPLERGASNSNTPQVTGIYHPLRYRYIIGYRYRTRMLPVLNLLKF
jgi:hypothetical protein